MTFPSVQRCKYKNSPVIEVVAQLNINAASLDHAELTEQKVSDMHAKMRDKFPFLNIEKQTQVLGQTSAGSHGNDTALPSRTIFHLHNQSSIRVSFDSQTIFFVSNKYTCWEDYRALIEYFLSNLYTICNPTFIRAGLRYRNVIERSKVGLSAEQWGDLISPQILPKIFIEKSIAGLSGFNTVLTFTFDDANAQIGLGSVINAATKEDAILIDCDIFKEEGLDHGSAISKLDTFNQHARRFFRWSITDRLHEAFGPN